MKKELKSFIFILLIMWSVVCLIAVITVKGTTSYVTNRYYNEQMEASNLAQKAMQKIKEEEIALGVDSFYKDKYNSGLIGQEESPITTILNTIEAKNTTINPNFAAMFIDMFREARVRKGDKIAIFMSGSFPSLNICLLAAAQVFELKPYIMLSFESSSFGANNIEFTYYDMHEFLVDKKIFTYDIDCISYGGENDIGEDYPIEVKSQLNDKIDFSKTKLLLNSNYEENISKRLDLITNKCGKIKLFINIGNNKLATGKTQEKQLELNGLVISNFMYTSKKLSSNSGLLEYMLARSVSVVNIINIKEIAFDYGFEYNPNNVQEVTISKVYKEKKYNILIPILAIGLFVIILIFYGIYIRKKRDFEFYDSQVYLIRYDDINDKIANVKKSKKGEKQ